MYSKRIIVDERADLSDFFFSLIFVGKMCVFVSRPMKIVNFLLKNADTPKRVVDFPKERDTFRNNIMEIVRDFEEKSYNNNNGKPWKSSRILSVNPIFSFFSPFFFHFFIFFFIFSFFHFFSFFSFFLFFFSSFSFFHFFCVNYLFILNFSFFHFFSFLKKFPSFFFIFSFY